MFILREYIDSIRSLRNVYTVAKMHTFAAILSMHVCAEKLKTSCQSEYMT